MKLILWALLTAAIVVISGCVASNTNVPGLTDAVSRCQQKCLDLVTTRADLSKGPCLDNNITAGWVCDMAHDPRRPVDDDPSNQCPAFGTTARHFVEVNENCRIIRAV
ncbi:MAG: hypothetical protein FJY76_02385 [Candidatus Aenigmarchaeota archaeon]|nr:hypothetical protein [Candidatus Aenigmarchaeota archaeon]